MELWNSKQEVVRKSEEGQKNSTNGESGPPGIPENKNCLRLSDKSRSKYNTYI
jgi:hypothetical protein